MKRIQGFAVRRMWLVALGISFIIIGMAQAHAQAAFPAFSGKFTLTTPVQWDKVVLQPGNYTITIPSLGGATLALVRDSSGRPVGRFISGIDDGKTNTRNALLIKEKGGQLHVYSLQLATQGSALVYDKALAREAVMEARGPQTVPVILAKR